MKRKDIIEQREQMQHDILCILDGLDDKVLDDVCEVVSDRMGILMTKYEERYGKDSD